MLEKSVKVFKKLAKVPSFVWCILLIASAFFAEMYSFFRVITPDYLNEIVSDTLNISGSSTIASGIIDTKPLWILTIITSPLISWGIFELVISLIYRNLFIRRQINSNVAFYRLVLRVCYIVINVLIGLFSLIYFAVKPDISVIGGLIFNPIVTFVVFTYAYGVLSWSVISPFAVGKAYYRLMKFFCILEGVLSAINLVELVLVYNPTEDLLSLIGICVNVVFILAYALVGYFVIYKKLLKRQKTIVETIIMPPRDDNNHYDDRHDDRHDDNKHDGNKHDDNNGNDEIFRGFGF